MPEPTMRDYAWAAGLFEGEGSAWIGTTGGRKAKRKYLKPRLCVCMANEGAIRKFHKLFGGTLFKQCKKGTTSHGITRKKDLWGVELTFRKALLAAYAMLPYVHDETIPKLQKIIDHYGETVTQEELQLLLKVVRL